KPRQAISSARSTQRVSICISAGWASDRIGRFAKNRSGATSICTRRRDSWTCFNLDSPEELAESVSKPRSLVPQRVNGIEERGFPGRIIAEENSHCGAEEESHQDGLGRDEGRPVLGRGNDFRRSRADGDSDDATQATERDGLDQELPHDITAA